MVNAIQKLNPFPGIRPFELDEEHLFFGREGQADELLTRLNRTRFLAVVGTSGSGKSSLVRAGLLPSLYSGFLQDASSGWRMAILRPGNSPIANLAAALNHEDVFGVNATSDDAVIRTALTESTLRRGSLGLVEVTQQARMNPHENLLVVVDQFEELFRFKNQAKTSGKGLDAENEAAAFVKLLLSAVKQREVPIFVVLTMRSDFLGDCAQFRDLPETLNDSQYLIPRLTREQLQRAIEGPVAVGGATITPRLVNRILNETGDNPDQLPIMQHALMRTWHYWATQNTPDAPLDLEHYNRVGGMAEALSRHADQIYDELPNARSRQIAETLFKCLTDRGADNRDIRRPTPLAEICAVADASKDEVITVIDQFRAPQQSFLMPFPPTPLFENTIIDISHESLMRVWKRLQDWTLKEAESARIYQRLAETALLYDEKKVELLRDPELAIVWDWKNRFQPNETWAKRYNLNFDKAINFLEQSFAVCYKVEQERIDTEMQRQLESRGNFDVFFSYSRKDKEFTKKLYSSLHEMGLNLWIDWEDLPIGSDWQQETLRAIRFSSNFIFIISPDSVASAICKNELENAATFGKRIIPIYYRETNIEEISPILRNLNWLFFREEEDFDSALKSLESVISTDLDYVHFHTRLLQQAVDWEIGNRDDSLLLRGAALRSAEHWINRSNLKDPKPTKLQQEYVAESRTVEERAKDFEQTLKESEQMAKEKVKKIRSRLFFAISIFSIFLAYGSSRFYTLSEEAKKEEAALEAIRSYCSSFPRHSPFSAPPFSENSTGGRGSVCDQVGHRSGGAVR